MTSDRLGRIQAFAQGSAAAIARRLTAGPAAEPQAPSTGETRLQALRHAIEHAAHYLPAQTPLEVFVHHNTLHAFQHLPFHDAVTAAANKFGARGYLREADYRAALSGGRITLSDLRSILAELPLPVSDADWPPALPPQAELRELMIVHGLRETTAAGLTWLLTERAADHRFRPDIPAAARSRILGETASLGAAAAKLGPARLAELAVTELWAASRQVSLELPSPRDLLPTLPRFPRDLLVAVANEDPSDLVHAALIPLCAAFLDRGQTQWSMPDREEGFLVAWRRVHGAGHAVRPAWEQGLARRIRSSELMHIDAEHVVLGLLDELGLADDELGDFIEHVLLQLPGWAGMFQRLQGAAGLAEAMQPKVTLVDFLAVRLSLDVFAYRDVAARLGFHGPLHELRAFLRQLPLIAPTPQHSEHETAWPVFQAAQLAGLSAAAVRVAGPAGARAILALYGALDEHSRLLVFHEAFERHYRDELLAALLCNRPHRLSLGPRRFQLICCIDDRLESFRRHLEEVAPDTETFGVAGFFNLAIAFQGLDDPSTFPLCPVVVKPRHQISEQPAAKDAHLMARRRRRRQNWGHLDATFERASRSLVWAPLLTAVSGLLAAIPLLGNVFAPRLSARIRANLARRLFPEVKTQLSPPAEPTPADPKGALMLQSGFTVEEKANRVGTLLENIGLTSQFAPLVVILGHDSRSVNNPHFAAYSCGACGGRSGGPNARLFARMVNRPQVRHLLAARGIHIPAGTLFVGGVHDTCADSITLYDEDVPAARSGELETLRRTLDAARRRNAQERSRRFASARPGLWPGEAGGLAVDQALRHVEERATDLSQARPELGHATNASCIVGRRSISRGLFLDRRAFLVSYDPSLDATGEILERILLAVGPVGAGINLEYFFSAVDNERYGAGTKLPHNVTGLVGVMNGASSDLRTGLPKQMIEIHEPVRLQLFIETRPEVLSQIVQRQPSIAELVGNEWVRVAIVDPLTGDIATLEGSRGFVPFAPPPWATQVPVVAESVDWYRGKADFIPPARLGGKGSGPAHPGSRSGATR